MTYLTPVSLLTHRHSSLDPVLSTLHLQNKSLIMNRRGDTRTRSLRLHIARPALGPRALGLLLHLEFYHKPNIIHARAPRYASLVPVLSRPLGRQPVPR